MSYLKTTDGAVRAANRYLAGSDAPFSAAAEAERELLAYLAQDDGTAAFLDSVKTPVLHLLGRVYYRQGKLLDAKRCLRDAYALSRVYPGNVPAYADVSEIEAFVENECGLDIP